MTAGADETAALVRAGSHAAFGEMFDAHAAEVLRFLERRCDPAVAEDLLSVVFLEAWRIRERALVVDGSLRPWLYGIAANVLRNARRSARRYAAALDRYHANNPPVAAPDAVGAAEDRAALRDALRRLPTREREVVDLCLVAELSADAAATVLGVPVATVRSRLARARKRLRGALTRTGELPHQPAPAGHERVGRRDGAPVGTEDA